MKSTYAEYAEVLGIEFKVCASMAEDYPPLAPESLREFFREVRKGAARLYRGRRAHERAVAEPADLFSGVAR